MRFGRKLLQSPQKLRENPLYAICRHTNQVDFFQTRGYHIGLAIEFEHHFIGFLTIDQIIQVWHCVCIHYYLCGI